MQVALSHAVLLLLLGRPTALVVGVSAAVTDNKIKVNRLIYSIRVVK